MEYSPALHILCLAGFLLVYNVGEPILQGLALPAPG